MTIQFNNTIEVGCERLNGTLQVKKTFKSSFEQCILQCHESGFQCWAAPIQYKKVPDWSSNHPCAQSNQFAFCHKEALFTELALFHRDSEIDGFDRLRPNFDPFNNWPLMYLLESAKPLMK